MFVVRRYSREGGANIVFEKEGATDAHTQQRVTSENYYYRYLKGNDGKSCIWATISIWKVSVDDLDIPWQWNYNGMKEKEKKGSSNEYKTVKRRLFQRKIFPFDSYYLEFDLIIVRARVKERNSIHSRMIGRETRKRVQEGCRRTFEKFDSFISRNGGRKKNLKSASSSRPPPSLERAGDFACTGRNGPEGTEARTNSCDRDWIARKSYPPTPRIAFISDFERSSSLRSCRQLSLSLLCNAFILYFIYIFYTEERLNSGGFYIR